ASPEGAGAGVDSPPAGAESPPPAGSSPGAASGYTRLWGAGSPPAVSPPGASPDAPPPSSGDDGAAGPPGAEGAGAGAPGVPGAPAAVIGWDCSTGRMVSFAVWPRLFAASPSLPGTVMTRLSPSVTTFAPDTPRPLTRDSMILRAWSRLASLGALPSGVRAVSVTDVPPCRSMPSCGVGSRSPVKNTSA